MIFCYSFLNNLYVVESGRIEAAELDSAEALLEKKLRLRKVKPKWYIILSENLKKEVSNKEKRLTLGHFSAESEESQKGEILGRIKRRKALLNSQ